MSATEIKKKAAGWRFFLTRQVVLDLCEQIEALERRAVEYQNQVAEAKATALAATEAHERLKTKHAKAVEGNRSALGFIYAHHLAGKRAA